MTTRNSLIDYFNEKLGSRGRTLDGRVIWRLSWSADHREKRLGDFSDFYGNIFLRQVKQVREVPKYWHINPPCWILERLTFLDPKSAIHREVLASVELDITKPTLNGSYECLYAFRDGAGNPLPVTEVALEAIFHRLLNRVERQTDGQMRDEYDAMLAQDTRYCEEELTEAGRSPLFAFENSVFMDSKKRLTYSEKGEPDAISVVGKTS